MPVSGNTTGGGTTVTPSPPVVDGQSASTSGNTITLTPTVEGWYNVVIAFNGEADGSGANTTGMVQVRFGASFEAIYHNRLVSRSAANAYVNDVTVLKLWLKVDDPVSAYVSSSATGSGEMSISLVPLLYEGWRAA